VLYLPLDAGANFLPVPGEISSLLLTESLFVFPGLVPTPPPIGTKFDPLLFGTLP